MVQVLRMGSRGPDVTRLQNALNSVMTPSPRLVPDGSYGGMTFNAVQRFQRANWLEADGIAGACTQNCAFGTETYTPILHSVAMIAQPTPTTCWAASTAMMTRSNVPAVIARTPASMILPDGSLANFSATDQGFARGQEYARIHNLRCNAPQSYAIAGLRAKLQRGPVMLDMLWDMARYITPNAAVPGTYLGSSGHMVVLFGMRGDDDGTGNGTTLRIHDPLPTNTGNTLSMSYARLMRQVPASTYRLFER